MQLPDRELASGVSEIIKYGLIRDAALFEWLEENIDKVLARDPVATAYAIERSCINKAEVVALDEREGGVRATLNLGHTFGHAIETATGVIRDVNSTEHGFRTECRIVVMNLVHNTAIETSESCCTSQCNRFCTSCSLCCVSHGLYMTTICRNRELV